MAAVLLVGCMDVGVDPGPATAPPRAETKPKIDCGPAPVEPAWSAMPSTATPEVFEVPARQWTDIARYLSDVRDWRDCLMFTGVLK